MGEERREGGEGRGGREEKGEERREEKGEEGGRRRERREEKGEEGGEGRGGREEGRGVYNLSGSFHSLTVFMTTVW